MSCFGQIMFNIRDNFFVLGLKITNTISDGIMVEMMEICHPNA